MCSNIRLCHGLPHSVTYTACCSILSKKFTISAKIKYTNTINDLLFVVFFCSYIQAFFLITFHVDLSSWDIVKKYLIFRFYFQEKFIIFVSEFAWRELTYIWIAHADITLLIHIFFIIFKYMFHYILSASHIITLVVRDKTQCNLPSLILGIN